MFRTSVDGRYVSGVKSFAEDIFSFPADKPYVYRFPQESDSAQTCVLYIRAHAIANTPVKRPWTSCEENVIKALDKNICRHIYMHAGTCGWVMEARPEAYAKRSGRYIRRSFQYCWATYNLLADLVELRYFVFSFFLCNVKTDDAWKPDINPLNVAG